MSFGRYVFLSMKVYGYRPDENVEIPLCMIKIFWGGGQGW